MLRPDILRSGVDAGLEAIGDAAAGSAAMAGSVTDDRAAGIRREPTGMDGCADPAQPPIGRFDRNAPDRSAEHRRDGAFAVRLGLADVSSIGTTVAERIVAEREERGPYRDMADVSRRAGLNAEQLEALAAAGAFDGFGLQRREALWLAGEAAADREEYLAGSIVVVQPPLLPMLSPAEQVVYDLWATGISPDDHPIRHIREQLDDRGAIRIDLLRHAESGRRIEVGGVVTHRQRPATASGITFMNLEDESGTLNVIAGVGVWNRYRRIAREAPAMIVRGILERSPRGSPTSWPTDSSASSCRRPPARATSAEPRLFHPSPPREYPEVVDARAPRSPNRTAPGRGVT